MVRSFDCGCNTARSERISFWQLTEPYFLDRRLSLSGQLFFNEADYLSSEYNQRNYGFSIEARKPINQYTYASLGYRLQNVDIFDVSSTASTQIQAAKGHDGGESDLHQCRI